MGTPKRKMSGRLIVRDKVPEQKPTVVQPKAEAPHIKLIPKTISAHTPSVKVLSLDDMKGKKFEGMLKPRQPVEVFLSKHKPPLPAQARQSVKEPRKTLELKPR